MPVVQFDPDYKRMLLRYKQKPNQDLSKCFLTIDEIARRLGAKDLKPKDRDALVNKLRDKIKKLKRAVKEDTKLRQKELDDISKDPPEDFDPQATLRTWRNVHREILSLEKKVQGYSERGGNPPPPPKLPSSHYGAEYKKLMVEADATLLPSVVSALDKVDGNHDAGKAMELIKAARTALEAQERLLTAQVSQSHDPKEKARLGNLAKELAALRKRLEEFEDRVFLIHRLKG